jgi:hypothetical protein
MAAPITGRGRQGQRVGAHLTDGEVTWTVVGARISPDPTYPAALGAVITPVHVARRAVAPTPTLVHELPTVRTALLIAMQRCAC